MIESGENIGLGTANLPNKASNKLHKIELEFNRNVKNVTADYQSTGSEIITTYTINFEPMWKNLSDYGGIPKIDEVDDDISDNGIYTFKIKNGESIIIPNIPAGSTYEIVEKDYSSEGYTTTVDGNETREVSGTITEDKIHNYVNRVDTAVPTNVTKGINYTLLGLLLATALSMYYLYYRKKHNHI